MFHPLFFKGCAVVLGTLAFLLAPFALMFRADSSEELAIGRQADILVGLLFAGYVLFARLPWPSVRRRVWLRRTLFFMAVVFTVSSGPLLAIHATVAKIRFGASPAALTRNRLSMIHGAMMEYIVHCGTPPTEGQGLAALIENPGAEGWNGPYLDAKDMTDGWGEPFRYSVRDGRVRIWSCGPDKQSGTEDDFVATVNGDG